MKRITFALFALVPALFAACSEDDPPVDTAGNGGKSGASAGKGGTSAGKGGKGGSGAAGAAGAEAGGGNSGEDGSAGAGRSGGSGDGTSGEGGTAGSSAGAPQAAGGPDQGGVAGEAGSPGVGVSCTQGPVRGDRPLKIMPLGDSITASVCYRALLWKELRDNGHTDFDFVGTRTDNIACGVSGYDIDNEGHGGYLVTSIATATSGDKGTFMELEQWVAPGREADIALMHFGTNDVWNGIAPATILSAYGTVIDQLRTRSPNLIVLLAQIIPMAPDETTCSGCTCAACPTRVDTLNSMIPAWAAAKSTADSPVCVVDQHTGFDVQTDTSERVHPNPVGSQKIADRWYAALAPLF